MEDAVDGGTVFVDLLGFAHELVDGGGIGESALGVEPPLLHAKNRIAANLFCICREQHVVEALQLGGRGSRAALDHAGQCRIRKQAAPQHHMARAGIGRHQRIHVLKVKNIAVVGHGKRRPLQCLAIKRFARRTRVTILLHTRMHDQFCQRHATVQIEHTLVLPVVLEPQPCLNGHWQRRALAHVTQKHLELIQVVQEARALALGDDRSRRTTQVKVDLAIAHIGKHLRCPHKLVRILGHKLGDDVESLVVGRVDFLKRLTAKAIANPRRRQKRRVIAIERTEALRMHAAEHMPGNPLHGG